MTHRYDIAIKATLVSPFVLPGLDVVGLGVDTAALRDEAGRPLIPGDQVKGLLRAAMVSLCGVGAASKQDLTDLFGRPSDKGGNDDPARGALITSDLVAYDADCTPGKHRITRIKINESTGAVQNGALQVVELVAPPGAAVTFTGTASLRCAPDAAARLIDLLQKAWKLLPAIGGVKSAGFGRVQDVTLALNGTGRPLVSTAAAVSTYDDTIWLDVNFDRRLLVDAQRLSDNVWRGSSIVPGTAIKGALSRVLLPPAPKSVDVGGDAGQALQTIRIGHAFPLGPHDNLLDLPVPQSAVLLETLHAGDEADKCVHDVLLCPPGTVPMGPNGAVPIYQGDWKGDEDRTGLPPSSDIPRLPRIHTRIGEHYTAKDGDLYVDIGLSPWLDSAQESPRRWRLRIDRQGADMGWYQRFVDILLQQGLDGVGKTGARARFTLASKATLPMVEPIRPGARAWAVTLITPTLMLPKDDCPCGAGEAATAVDVFNRRRFCRHSWCQDSVSSLPRGRWRRNRHPCPGK